MTTQASVQDLLQTIGEQAVTIRLYRAQNEAMATQVRRLEARVLELEGQDTPQPPEEESAS